MAQEQPSAVITGDLVGSTRKSRTAIEQAMAALAEFADAARHWVGAPLCLTRSRGDGWQVRLARPELALRTALAIRARVKALPSGLDTRAAFALGDTAPPAGADLNRETGPVYVASGRALDHLPDGTHLVYAGTGPLAAATLLAGHLADGWTRAQSAALQYALAPNKPADREIAALLGISQQAVSKNLAAAGFHAIVAALAEIEADP